MPKSDPQLPGDCERVIEHVEPSPAPPPRGFTAWHHFLSRALDGTKADGFDVQCFVRLGELPLKADVILLRRKYTRSASAEELGPFAVLYDEVFLTEIKKMARHNTPGNQQLLEDADRTPQSFLDRLSPEQRMKGLPAEERMKGIPPEERLKGLPPEERLKGLPPEELLRGLSPDDLARIRDLLQKPESH